MFLFTKRANIFQNVSLGGELGIIFGLCQMIKKID